MKEVTFLQIIKRLWKYSTGTRLYMLIYVFTSLVTATISVVIPLLSAKLILGITDGIIDEILLCALFILLVEIIRNIFSYLNSLFSNKIFYKIVTRVQKDICKETLNLDIKEVDAHSSGVFIDRITKDAGTMSDTFTMTIWYVMQIIQNIGILVTILIISPYAFIFVMIMLMCEFGISRKRASVWFKRRKIINELAEKNSGLIGELVRGIRDIKVLNASANIIDKTIGRIKNTNEKEYALAINQDRFTLLDGSVRDLFQFLFIIFCVLLYTKDLLAIDAFLILYTYYSKTIDLNDYISNFLENAKKFTLAGKRVFEVIDSTFKKEKFGSVHLDKIEGDFKFNNVYFGYDNINVLKGINFEVKPNETVAFVGRSGAGKSTIFGLIDRLYKVDSGVITIDGIDINDLDRDSVRNNISIITQSPYIFNFTIRENLLIAKEDASEEELIEACKVAKLHDFIMSLENGYDTLVGEGGVSLSGGQRQRLAIARALLKKTEIILFDEATSALDNETQKDVQTAINNLKGEYTILMIAHRLSTVINSDRILLIDDGKVIASGTHEYLLKHNKLYSDLYKTELI